MCFDRLSGADQGFIASDGDGLLAFRFDVRFFMFLSRVRRRIAGRAIDVFVADPVAWLSEDGVR